jgi:hypothetical protein
MTDIAFEDVRERWLAAGGTDTGGIINWFQPPFVQHWELREIAAADVADLRFIGTDAAGGWDQITNGTSRVGDAQLSPPDPGFAWNLEWALIAVLNPENGERVILDGNKRARQLHLAVAAGAIPPDQKVQLIAGELWLVTIRIAKSLSPLWR